MSHQVRTRCPVSGLNFDRSSVDEEGCFPSSPSQLSQPLCEVSRAGTTVSVLQMTTAKRVATSALSVNYQLCANSERGFCVNSDSTISCSPSTGQALFPAHHFISCFLKHHLWRMFWSVDLGGESCGIFFNVLRVERRSRNHTWLPALVIVSHYLTVLIPYHMFPP